MNWFVEMRIHPIVVHFPIAMLTLAWVAIVAVHAGWGDTSKWKAYIGPLEWFGVIALAPTVLSGFRDAGWMELKIATLGGFSIMWYGRFTEVLKLRHKSALPIPTYTCLHLRSCWHVKQTLVTLLISTRHPDTQSD